MAVAFGHRVRSNDRPLPRSEIPLAASRQRILEGDSRIGAQSGSRDYSEADAHRRLSLCLGPIRTALNLSRP